MVGERFVVGVWYEDDGGYMVVGEVVGGGG